MEETLHDSGLVQVSTWRSQGFVFDMAHRRLLRDGVAVEVEDRVFDLIALLLTQRDRALDRRELIETLWGPRPVSDATLRQLVHKARRTLGDEGEHQQVIRTLYGRSLQWVAPVEAVTEAPDAWVPQMESRSSAFETGDDVSALDKDAREAREHPLLHVQPARRRVRPWLLGALMLVLAFGVGVAWWQRTRPRQSNAFVVHPATTAVDKAPVTIAVLPFLNMDADQNQQYLSDGLTDELINRLGRFPQLRVAARTSSFMFRNKPVDARDAASALGVANVLEGDVQRSGDRLRVRVALVNAKDGYELWSDEYDPAVGNLLTVEDEIAEAVIGKLRPELDANAVAAMRSTRGRTTADPAAHDFYLIGLQYLNRRTVPDIEQALDYFKRAILADPDYALAWSGVADAYNLLREHNSDSAPDTYYAEALSAAQKSVDLDPQLARAHLVLALLHEAHWEWAPAEREYQRALQLDPSDPVAHLWYGAFQWYLRNPKKALVQLRLAHDLDPLLPIVNTDLARTLLFDHQDEAAIAQFKATLKLDPGFALAHLLLAQAYMANHRYQDGVKEARTAIALVPAPPPSSYLSVYGIALFFDGDRAGARQQLQILEARSRQHYVSGVSLALLQAQVGSKQAMYANLARAVADHDALMRPAVASPDSPWYGDPRFNALLVRMGLSTKY